MTDPAPVLANPAIGLRVDCPHCQKSFDLSEVAPQVRCPQCAEWAPLQPALFDWLQTYLVASPGPKPLYVTRKVAAPAPEGEELEDVFSVYVSPRSQRAQVMLAAALIAPPALAGLVAARLSHSLGWSALALLAGLAADVWMYRWLHTLPAFGAAAPGQVRQVALMCMACGDAQPLGPLDLRERCGNCGAQLVPSLTRVERRARMRPTD